MPFADKLKEAVIGKPHDPLNPDTRQHLALVAFLAWIGLVSCLDRLGRRWSILRLLRP